MLEDDDAFLSKADVRSMVQLSYAEIARRQKRQAFPPSIALGPFRTSRRVFLRSSIRNWMAEQIAAALARGMSSKWGAADGVPPPSPFRIMRRSKTYLLALNAVLSRR